MRKIILITAFLWATAIATQAQDCATGYCPKTLTVYHKQGDVSPISVNITYNVIETDAIGDTTCWITRNLGATADATAIDDNSSVSAGWYWQFNRKQGYYHDGSTRTPSVANWITSIDEGSDWLPENDPCTILLGGNWRLPTSTEWTNAMTNLGVVDGLTAYNTGLKLRVYTGYLSDATLYQTATDAFYASSTQFSTTDQYYLYLKNTTNVNDHTLRNMPKARACSVRCIRTY